MSSEYATIKRIGGGTGVSVGIGATVVLGTYTKAANELLLPPAGWVTNAVAAVRLGWADAMTASTDAVVLQIRRTAVANQYQVVALGGTVARTIDWAMYAIDN